MSLPQDRFTSPECCAEPGGSETPDPAGAGPRCLPCQEGAVPPDAGGIAQAPLLLPAPEAPLPLPDAAGAGFPAARRQHHRRQGRSRIHRNAIPLIMLAGGVLLVLMVVMLLSAVAANRMLGGRENPLAARDPRPDPSASSGGDAAPKVADPAAAIAIKDLFQITPQSAHSAPEGDGPISALAFAPDGKHLLCVRPEAPAGRRYQVLDRVNGRIAILDAEPPSGTTEPALFALRRGPDGDSIRLYGPRSAGQGAPGAYVWDPDGGKSERITGPPREFLALALAPDGITAAVGERSPAAEVVPRALTRLTRLDSDLTRAKPAGPVLADRAVVRLRFSDDGAVLAGEFPPDPEGGSASPTVRAWRVPGGEPLGPGAEGSLVALLDAGKVLVTAAGGPDGIDLLSFREAADGALEGTIDPRLGHSGPVTALAFHRRGLAFATAGGSGEVLVKGMPDGAPLASLTGLGTAPPRAVAFSDDGSLLAAADARGRICIWNLGRLEYPSSSVAPASIPDGRPVAAASPVGHSPSPGVQPDPASSIPPPAPKLWLEIPTGPGASKRGEPAFALAASTPSLAAKVFDGPKGAIGSFSVWDLEAKAKRRSIPAGAQGRPEPLVALSGDGRALGLGESDGILIDIETGRSRPLASPGPSGCRFLPLGFAPGGRGVLVEAVEGESPLVLLDFATLQERGGAAKASSAPAWAWSPEGRAFAAVVRIAGEAREALVLLDPETLAPKAELERWRVHEAASGPASLAFSPDGSLLAHIRPRASAGGTSRNGPAASGGRGGWEGGLTLWDLSTNPPSRRHVNDKIRTFAFFGGGRLGSAMGQAADLSTIDVGSGQVLRTILLSYAGRRVTDPAISTAGSLRAVGISDGRVRLDRISAGGNSPPTEFRAHTGEVAQLAFTADGSFLVTAGADGFIKVWRPSGE